MFAENSTTAFERHYRIGELARLWGIGRETIRKILVADNGPGILRIKLGTKKSHVLWAVSETAAKRIYTKLMNGG